MLALVGKNRVLNNSGSSTLRVQKAPVHEPPITAVPLAIRSDSDKGRAMTASQILEDLIATLMRKSGGTKRGWRLAIGRVHVHDLATHPHCNWSVTPSGNSVQNAVIERVLDDLRLSHPIVREG
jgi:hypothetical protein